MLRQATQHMRYKPSKRERGALARPVLVALSAAALFLVGATGATADDGGSGSDPAKREAALTKLIDTCADPKTGLDKCDKEVQKFVDKYGGPVFPSDYGVDPNAPDGTYIYGAGVQLCRQIMPWYAQWACDALAAAGPLAYQVCNKMFGQGHPICVIGFGGRPPA